MNHTEVSELLAAYALDAVDPTEAAEIENHLLTCRLCQLELAEHHQIAGAFLAEDTPPPPAHVWEKISQQLAEAPPPLHLVHEGPKRSPLKRLWIPLAAAAIIVVGGLGIQVARLESQISNLQASVSRVGLAQVAALATLQPGSTHIRMVSSKGKDIGEVIVRPNGLAYMVTSSLPALSAERVYQIWGLSGHQVVSLGLLGRDPSPSVFKVDSRITTLMITAEPEGGVVTPTGPILGQGTVAT